MYLLYLDESGDINDPGDHFVVGGVAVHESRARHMNRAIENVARRHLHFDLELHAQWIRTGKGPWGRIPRHVKEALLSEVPAALASPQATLFAVVRAPNAVPTADPLERTFEELLLRFTQMLVRINRDGRDEHGIVIADKARYEETLQPLVQRWRTTGTRFARLRRLVEVPLFIDSRATRLTQAADFVAHGVYRFYHAGDDRLFTPLLNRFDTVDGGSPWLGPSRPELQTVPLSRVREPTGSLCWPVNRCATTPPLRVEDPDAAVAVHLRQVACGCGGRPRRREKPIRTPSSSNVSSFGSSSRRIDSSAFRARPIPATRGGRLCGGSGRPRRASYRTPPAARATTPRMRVPRMATSVRARRAGTFRCDRRARRPRRPRCPSGGRR